MRRRTVLLLLPCSALNAQPVTIKQLQPESFEALVLGYEPEQRPGVTDAEYDYAIMILDEVRSATKGDPLAFNVADYLNVLSAFLTLQEQERTLRMVFDRMVAADTDCGYLRAFAEKARTNPKYAPVREAWREALAQCGGASSPEAPTDWGAYARTRGLDEALVRTMVRVKEADQRHRGTNGGALDEQQRALDRANLATIDSLAQRFGGYVGRDLVGPDLETVMWAVIQHADVRTMGAYLPMVAAAVREGQLASGPLKMLLDRYHGLQYGYQLFGTQSGFGFEMADEATRERIAAEYGLR